MKRYRKGFVRCALALLVIVIFAVPLTGCSHDDEAGVVSPSGVVIPPTTKVLDASSALALSSISEDGSRLTFSEDTAQVRSLSPGDVIVSGASDAAPYGLLRKVSSVSIESGKAVVETSQATIEDAIEEGTIELNKTLTPQDVNPSTTAGAYEDTSRSTSDLPSVSMEAREDSPSGEASQANGGSQTFSLSIDDIVLYDADGNSKTTGDQIRANGSISFDISFKFDAKIEDYRMRQLSFTTSISETERLELTAETSYSLVDKTVTIGKPYCFNLIPIPGTPLVVLPKLALEFSLNGKVSAGMESSLTQTATVTAGLSYKDGEWAPVKEFSNRFEFAPPSFSAGATAKASVGPKLSLLVCGVTGPTAAANGYLELDADPLKDPWWTLYGGFKADVGVTVDVLSHVIAEYHATVIDFKKVVAQSESSEAQPGSHTLTSIAVAPASPESLAVGSTQQFVATGTYSDKTTADITSQVAWRSSDAGVASISSNGLATGLTTGSTNVTASLSGVASNSAALTVAATIRNSILGTWSLVNDLGLIGTMTFRQDGTCDVSAMGLTASGIYSFPDATHLKFESQISGVEMYQYSISGDSMTLRRSDETSPQYGAITQWERISR